MKIEIDDRTFDVICRMSPEALKTFFSALKDGIEIHSEIPKGSGKIEKKDENSSPKNEFSFNSLKESGKLDVAINNMDTDRIS